MNKTILVQVMDDTQFKGVWEIVHTSLSLEKGVLAGFQKVTGIKGVSACPVRRTARMPLHDDWQILDKNANPIGMIRIRYVHPGRMEHRKAVEKMLSLK